MSYSSIPTSTCMMSALSLCVLILLFRMGGAADDRQLLQTDTQIGAAINSAIASATSIFNAAEQVESEQHRQHVSNLARSDDGGQRLQQCTDQGDAPALRP